MGRIMAIDYGQKRVGLAATDMLRMIASPIGTIHSKDIFPYLTDYLKKNIVDCIVVGKPKQLDNSDSQSAAITEAFVKNLKKNFPLIEIVRIDERFTSKMAFQTMIDSGLKKKDRQNKALVDTISAVIILQSYMEMLDFNKKQL
ncbi:MAG: Holliday junction resolvase RuvX [Bacteroidales bacterium]|nr:Holliday junction resolvase RuvX [Bacteroidales bacterium]